MLCYAWNSKPLGLSGDIIFIPPPLSLSTRVNIWDPPSSLTSDVMLCESSLNASGLETDVCDICQSVCRIWTKTHVSPDLCLIVKNLLISKLCPLSSSVSEVQGGHIWHPNWVRLASNGTNLGLFKISFSRLHFGSSIAENWS